MESVLGPSQEEGLFKAEEAGGQRPWEGNVLCCGNKGWRPACLNEWVGNDFCAELVQVFWQRPCILF